MYIAISYFAFQYETCYSCLGSRIEKNEREDWKIEKVLEDYKHVRYIICHKQFLYTFIL